MHTLLLLRMQGSFLSTARHAAERNWSIEIWSWRRNRSSSYDRLCEDSGRYIRLFELDDVREQLLLPKKAASRSPNKHKQEKNGTHRNNVSSTDSAHGNNPNTTDAQQLNQAVLLGKAGMVYMYIWCTVHKKYQI
jgi:hypothetical protein